MKAFANDLLSAIRETAISPRLRVSVVNPFFLIRVYPRKSAVGFSFPDRGDLLAIRFQQLLGMLS